MRATSVSPRLNRHAIGILKSAQRSPIIAIILAAVAVLIAALAGAILLYDGAFFLFRIMDRHQIEIPQLRISFAQLQIPAVWAAKTWNSVPVTRFVFSLMVMATPPLALALCWWVVRKQAPMLMVWPAIGILLVDLPGQMHWIATSIRTNQLFWPILLAIFIGMPDRVVPAMTVILIFILFMHPQVSVYLAAGVCAALWLAWRRPEHRQRLLGTALVMAFASMYRYTMLDASYEAQEASFSNQIGQWQRSVLWLPLIALVCMAIVGVALVWAKRQERIPSRMLQAGAAFFAIAAVVMVIWGADPALWRHAIDYRGPSMWHSLLLMGLAFLDVIIRGNDQSEAFNTRLRIAVTNGCGALFCLVIALQSLGWRGELNKLHTAMAESETACVPTTAIPGFDDSPLDFWSLPAASLGIQTTDPDHIVLPPHLCQQAGTTGIIPISLTAPGVDTGGRYMNMSRLRGMVVDSDTCLATWESNWYPTEEEAGGTRKWNSGTGAITLTIGSDTVVELRGTLNTLQTPNEVQIIVNGQVQRSLLMEDDPYVALDGIQLQLQAGENLIEFRSLRPGEHPEGDERLLAVAVINLEIKVAVGEGFCVFSE